jgi:uncharacterized protein YaiI (UPF0178 family)
MKIFVDADACPVKEEILAIARKHDIDVVFVVSMAGYFDRGWNVEKIMVDSLPQAVDITIVNRMEAGDIVVTQDYGLAWLVLGKKGKAISPSGYVFTDQNIDRCLQRRQMHADARKAGIRTKGPKKRSRQDSDRFAQRFRTLLQHSTSSEETSYHT